MSRVGRACAALAVVAVVVVAAGCPAGGASGGTVQEPTAEAVPAELDWPDAAERVAGADAGVLL